MRNHLLKIFIFKRNYILLLSLFLFSVKSFTQGVNCISADPFCTNSSYTFPASTNVPDMGSVGCLYTTPNPAWYWMQIDHSGNLTINISSGYDVDYICWGPFNSLSEACATDLMTNSGISCSYSTAAQETCTIPNAVTGQVYVLLITNYANQVTNISFSQSGGSGTTNCGIVAPPVTNNGPLCIGETLNLTITNPTPGATYSWTGPNGWTSSDMNPVIPNVNLSNAGTYSLVISINSQTSTPVTTTVEVNSPPTITTNASPSSICLGTSSTLTATGGQFYTWSTAQSGATISVSPTHYTMYTVTVTSANGCTAIDSVSVNIITPPTANAGLNDSICSHTYTMNAIPSVGTGTWTSTGPGIVSYVNSHQPNTEVSVSTDGLYTFVWTEDNSGCISRDTVLIRFTQMPVTNAGTDISVCQLNTSLNAIPSVGNGTWTQISGPGAINFNDLTIATTPISTITEGVYTLQWTEDNGHGCVQNDMVNVTMWNMPNANAGVLDSICSLTYQLNAQPTFGIGTWSQISGPGYSQFINLHAANSPATVTQHGNYNFLWTENNNGCISSDTVTIIYNYTPTSTFSIAPINCFGDTTTVTFSGLVDNAVVYNWNFGNANIISGNNDGPYYINYSTDGTFNVSLTVSQHGCVSNPTTIQITNPPLLDMTLQKSDVSCFGAMDGKIFALVTGGTPPYYYHWSSGALVSFITNAIQGDYYLTVTDMHNCTIKNSTYINEPNKLFIDIPDTIAICKDSSITITASVTGGTFPYSLQWNTGLTQSTITVSPQVTTTYAVTVSDVNQCQASENLLVYIYPPLELSYVTSKDSICTGELFSIYPSADHGNGGPYHFYLNQQETSLPIHVYPTVFSNSYELMVKDGCNYIDSAHIPVVVYPLPIASPSSSIPYGCNPWTMNFVDASPDSGQKYVWNFGDNESAYIKNPTHTFKNDGNYYVSLTVTSIHNCKANYPNYFTITVYPDPTGHFEPSPYNRVNITKPIFDFINYSTLADSVQWYFGDGDSSNIYQPTHTYPAVPGVYNVMLVVRSENNCVDTVNGNVVVEDVFTFYAPSAFSPNDDGINDGFKVYGNGIDSSTFYIQIFNRWGEVIWETNNFDKAWDGKKQDGKVVPIGTYTWLAKFRDFHKILHEESGSVTVIR